MTLNAIIANFQTFKIVDLLDIIIIAFLIERRENDSYQSA